MTGIQDLEPFLAIPVISEKMPDADLISAATKAGADQMTCVRLLRKLKGYTLSEADDIVSKSREWKAFTKGNQWLRDVFFDVLDEEE